MKNKETGKALAKAKGIEVSAREYEKTATGKDKETLARVYGKAKMITILLENL